tara:strand:+ start:3020 stop:3724 length:705 start_codon:yes stop_codon:yes gene_type:complete
MILTAHQPTYLPWLGLFNKIFYSDKYVFFDDVQYLPKEWMNRNKIKTNDDKVIYLTVPVIKKNFLNKKTNKIEINNSLPWRRKHLKSLEMSYKKTKHFDKYFYKFEEIYKNEWKYLSDLNLFILKIILDILEINIKIVNLSELKLKGRKSDLIINMCKKLNASTFIFGEQGLNYADLDKFKKNNIKVIFQKYKHPTYHQIGKKFISHLSILDLIFNCGDESKEIINNKNNKLIK